MADTSEDNRMVRLPGPRPDLRGLHHESVGEFLARGGRIARVPSVSAQDVVDKLMVKFRKIFDAE